MRPAADAVPPPADSQPADSPPADSQTPDPPGGGGLADLVEQAREGRPRAVARLISLVEAGSPRLPELMGWLAPTTGRAHVVGLTGPPGVGKSTATTALVTALRSTGTVVGVLAVDPSSPFTGGALLGDRVRMQTHALDSGVFIRSMATRGHLGGLAAAAPAAIRVLEAAGCDVVLVETVGVGQSEVEVAGCVDTTCVLLAPGSGDAVQVAKAGVLEIGDVYVVNKADRDGAQGLVRELRTMLALAPQPATPTEPSGGVDAGVVPGPWRPSIVQTVAVRADGVAELVTELRRHRESQQATGEWERRRQRRAGAEIESLALARVRAEFTAAAGTALADLAGAVSRGEQDPYRAAGMLLERVAGGSGGPAGPPAAGSGEARTARRDAPGSGAAGAHQA